MNGAHRTRPELVDPADRFRMRRLSDDEMFRLTTLAREGRTGPSRMIEALWELILAEAEGVTLAEASTRDEWFAVQNYAICEDQDAALVAAMTLQRRLPDSVVNGFRMLWLNQSPATYRCVPSTVRVSAAG